MAKEICISTTPHETRLAIVEDEQLTEIYYERENEYTLAGSIYKGKVTRVLPGMQSAFVELGLERDAFLYVTDFLDEQEDPGEFEGVKQASGQKDRSEGGRSGRRNGAERNGAERNGAERGGADRAASEKGIDRVERAPAAVASRRRDEPEGSATAEAEGEAGAAGKTDQDEFQEGTRRWRGRRGRRRGIRGVRGQEAGTPASSGDADSQEPRQERRYEPSAGESGTISIEAEADDSQEATHAPSRAAENPRSGRRERGRALQESPTVTLPGEALQKYGQQPVVAEGQASSAHDESKPRPSQVTVRPSTLVESPIEWDGVSVAMPGETLSRHRDRPARGAEAAAVSPVAAEPVFAEPAPPELHAVSSETGSIDTVFPPAHAEEHASASEEGTAHAPLILEEEETAEEEETVPGEQTPGEQTPEVHSDAQEEEFDPERASASHRVDPSSPSEFRLSSLFGQKHEEPADDAEATERAFNPEEHEIDSFAPHAETAIAEHPVEEHAVTTPATADGTETHVETSTERPHMDQAHTDHAHEAAALDHIHAFTPGDGQVEEEVIDEEEYDFAPLPEHAMAHDDHDLNDLVEEETQVAGGSEIGEVIRDAHIDRQVTSSDDDEFDDSEEDDDEAEEEQPAAAVAGEEGAPAPRRPGRNDRQRGSRDRRGRGGRNGRRQSAQTSDLPIISELLKQGQEILVQIAKEPIAKKGARITSHIALPGRFLVFMPTVNHVGVSRKIWSDEERQRLKRVLISEKGEASGGFIVRTAAENATEEELRADLRFLISLWTEIKQRSDAAKAPALIYHDLNLIERILRDQVSDSFSTIWVDSEAEYERIVRFLNRFQPSLVRRVKLYTKETPLFEHFGIQDEITKALKSKVWLKSGGSIVINQTEALVAIDINTGKYVGKTARLEDTILKTNLDAIPEIVRQIRLRDLGGIIVIDFIDMDERKNRHKVMQALEEELKSDRAPSKVLQFNDFGLVAITRKRVKQSLERTLSVQCNICAGTGMVKSPITVANEIYIEMRKMQKHFERRDVMLRVHPEVVKTLKGSNARWLNELEEMTGRTVIVKSDPALHPEQFDIH